jgi:mono/diheme cytochrome c family protein
MRRLFRLLIRLVLILLIVIAIAVAVVYVLTERRIARTYQVKTPRFTAPTDEGAAKRGERLARVVLPCFECHGEDYGGKIMVNTYTMGRLAATNLTRGRGGIAGSHTDEDWARVMLHGVRRDGRSVIFMPSHEFKITSADLGDMVAYFRALPPVDRELPPMRIGPMPRILSYATGFPLLPAELIAHDSVGFKAPPADTSALSQGRHLAEVSCSGCHRPDYTGGAGPPPGSSNITTVGIGTWSEADFVRAMREHKRPNGTMIDESMPRAFGGMSDAELHAIYTYLQTVPAKGEKMKRQL